MSMSVFRLMQLHQRLDEKIGQERRNRLPDLFQIQRLKKMKLAVKDRLHRLGLGRRTNTA